MTRISTRRIAILAAGMALFGGTALTASPASAVPTAPSGANTATATFPSASTAAAASCSVTRWGYKGTAKCNTTMDVDWDGNGSTDETFVIAPDRTIWHTWKAAGAWKEMPGNGRADDTYGVATIGTKYRDVFVLAGGTVYCSAHFNGSWHGWAKTCPA
ncbi:hypothetical protein [Embleya sp. NPDC059237]|uniref:hypothetical protein n=1 Tax=Embleya sp. NPDC059237 TaxID=3346784 RepID=UPI003676A1E3